MKKCKTLLLGALLVLTLSFATGCGSNNDNGDNGSNTTENGTTDNKDTKDTDSNTPNDTNSNNNSVTEGNDADGDGVVDEVGDDSQLCYRMRKQ